MWRFVQKNYATARVARRLIVSEYPDRTYQSVHRQTFPFFHILPIEVSKFSLVYHFVSRVDNMS